MTNLFNKAACLLTLAVSAAACGSDSTPPQNTGVGGYTAISFVTTGNSAPRDELGAGGSVTLNLASDGTTSGHLHVAASGANPVFDSELPGTWTMNNAVITIAEPSVDTFIEDMPFTLSHDPANGWILTGDQVFSGTRIQLTLRMTSCPTC